MLVQSHAGQIQLLPALPSAWPTGAVTGLCARGGFEVDMTWKDGQLTSAVIRSKSGQPCRVTYRDKTWESDTEDGATYRLDHNLNCQGDGNVTPEQLMDITRLHCEYREQPLGIGHPQPRLGWELASDVRGAKQTAYRVLVASTAEGLKDNKGDLWDSGKVRSSQSVGVAYAGAPPASGQRCFWKVMVWENDGTASEWSAPAFWEMGLLKASDWQAEWIGDGKPTPEKDEDFFEDDPAPLFRKPFKLSGPVKSSRLYISALGYYRASLNGEVVGDHQLDPLWTLPHKRVFYSVYDVTEHLSPEENCLGVELGNGWYNPLPLRLWGRRNLREHLPVGRPQFIARLLIEYADGSIETIVSDASWRFTQGPILQNNIYLGEKVDARKNIPGWNRPELDDRGWSAVKTATAPEGALTAQPSSAIKVTKKFRPVAVTEPADGVYIVDMGQNTQICLAGARTDAHPIPAWQEDRANPTLPAAGTKPIPRNLPSTPSAISS